MPDELQKEKKEIVKKKQNPEEVEPEIRQSSEFEKKELFDPNQIAALIDKSKEKQAEVLKKDNKMTKDQKKTSIISKLKLYALS